MSKSPLDEVIVIDEDRKNAAELGGLQGLSQKTIDRYLSGEADKIHLLQTLARIRIRREEAVKATLESVQVNYAAQNNIIDQLRDLVKGSFFSPKKQVEALLVNRVRPSAPIAFEAR